MTLRFLTDELLVFTYHRAESKKLDDAFIRLLIKEIESRHIKHLLTNDSLHEGSNL